MPLAEHVELQHELFSSMKIESETSASIASHAHGGGASAGGGALSLEQMLERGQISVAEYQARILEEPPPERERASTSTGQYMLPHDLCIVNAC